MIQEIQEIGKLVDLQNAPKRKHCKERVKLFFPLFEAYVTFKNKQKLVMINYQIQKMYNIMVSPSKVKWAKSIHSISFETNSP